MGIVGYDEVYSAGIFGKPAISGLLKGLPRIWALRLISNIQNKLVEKPFYNPDFVSEDITPIDAFRFFLGPGNKDELLKGIRNYEGYLRRKAKANEQPMTIAASAETPLYLLRKVMAITEGQQTDNIAELERKLFKAFLLANDATMNRNNGENPYTPEADLEMYVSALMISRFAHNEFTNQQKVLSRTFTTQTMKCQHFFEFVQDNDKLRDTYSDFLAEYGISDWREYLRTIMSVVALLKFHTGSINLAKLQDEDQLIAETIFKKDSIGIDEIISEEDNIDYVAFRSRPFIKIAEREYAVIDNNFVMERLYNGLYFTFLELWKKRYPDRGQEFNRIYTTEFSEEYLFDGILKEIAQKRQAFSLTDNECKVINKKTDSPPDFYIRNGKKVILFENKDVKIEKAIKEGGRFDELLPEIDKKLVGEEINGKWKVKGVGQLVRNAKRIQDGIFPWDKEADRDSTIYLVLVVADHRQTALGWKNYLDRNLRYEIARQGADGKKIRPLILMDVGTLEVRHGNFEIRGFEHCFEDYFKETVFEEIRFFKGNWMLNAFNMTMSFSDYMENERSQDTKKMWKKTLGNIKKDLNLGRHTVATKTLVYQDFYDDGMKEEVLKQLENSAGKNYRSVLATDFSEKSLFVKAMYSFWRDKRIKCFDDSGFRKGIAAPDFVVKTRHDVFIFESKDLKMKRGMEDGTDIDRVMTFMDEQLNKKKDDKKGNKGLTQLVQFMEEYFQGDFPDVYGCPRKPVKENMRVHPILVMSNRLFSVRGVNYVLQHKLNERIDESEILRQRKKQIEGLIVMDLDMVMFLASAKGGFTLFRNMMSSYLTQLRKGQQDYHEYSSFRVFTMNRLELMKNRGDNVIKSDKMKRLSHKINHE